MSKFTMPLKIEFQDSLKHRLLESFEYYRTDDASEIYKVPRSFITDFASVPRLFWTFLPPTGTKKSRYGKAAVLHDYLYDTSCKYKMSRRQADLIFLEAMKAVKVSSFTRYLLYYCVRLFGKRRYSNPLGEQ